MIKLNTQNKATKIKLYFQKKRKTHNTQSRIELALKTKEENKYKACTPFS